MTQFKSKTIAVRTGIESDTQYGSVVPPICLSTNFGFSSFGHPNKYDYSRSGNPTRSLLEKTLYKLEHGEGAVITNSGMSALNLLVSAMVGPDDLIVAPMDCYGGSYRLLNSRAKKRDFKVLFIDQTSPKEVELALAQMPKLILLETPSNPLLRVVDITEICGLAKKIGALVAVDNTFLSPIYQTPITLGADFVIHSTTKYLNGHSDVIGGVVISETKELANEIVWWGNCIGATGTAFDSYLTLRGIRTLHPRMKLHEENTKRILAYLKKQPLIKTLYHPILASHIGHSIAERQQQGYGCMISFELVGSSPQLEVFINELKLFSLAESLGGVESLICHPATMTHRAMGAEALRNVGISQNLLRLSVGLEDADDLIQDLDHAFKLVQSNLSKIE
ncbi:cystathionine gamma-synthase [Celerinatantimonas yamalensis]|uniref:Cystathionine gamma-synthase n=1 Tax=Celerinatantimonas yamalensis TaxID=559956 RepID=A0ABW9G2W0_9GAMM